MMFAANAFVIIGCGISMINNIWVILVGRFIWGLGAGSFTVFVPKFINETAPTE
jgi:MFS family permease